jgi:hypothetical protein
MDVKKFRIPFAVIILALGIVLGLQIDKVFSDDSLRANLVKFNDVLTYIEKYYVEDVDTNNLLRLP